MSDFLGALFDGYPRDRFVELRSIKAGKVKQEFHLLSDGYEAITTSALDLDRDGQDCFVGVVPRDRPGGKAIDCPFMVRNLWADLDAKTVGSKDVAIRSLVDFNLRPNVIVDSGHGGHGHWILRDATEFTNAHDIMRGIARELHGDSVADAPRVLRLPGTHNHKSEPIMPVRLVYLDVTRRYRAYDFSDLISRPMAVPVLPLVTGEPIADLPSWLSDLIVTGAPKGARSEACYKAVLWLLRYGYDADGIRAVFEQNESGIGMKYHEKGRSGSSWLNYTIQAARRAIQ